MLPDGIYKYYVINENDGSRARRGSIQIIKQNLYIMEDPFKVLSHMFKEGPVSRKTEDIMKSVNRNGYAAFIKDNGKVVKTQDEMSDIEKGEMANKLRAGAMGLALAASTAIAPQQGMETHTPPIAQQAQAMKAPAKPNKEKDRILASIMDVESSNNANRNHAAPANKKLHGQEKAYGGYGLMPLTIRETIKANPKVFKDHQGLIQLKGSDLHNYMDKNPGLEEKVASTHYDRVAKIFGHDPAKIGMAWINGIQGTKDAIKGGTNLNDHWHVQKILKAHEARKKSGNK
jgi:hypothetical protein